MRTTRRLISGLVGIAALAAGVTTSAGAAGATGTATDEATTAKAPITASCVKSNEYVTDPWRSTYRLVYCDNSYGAPVVHPRNYGLRVGVMYSTRSWFGCKTYMGTAHGYGYYTWADEAVGSNPQNGWGLMPSRYIKSGNPHIIPTCET